MFVFAAAYRPNVPGPTLNRTFGAPLRFGPGVVIVGNRGVSGFDPDAPIPGAGADGFELALGAGAADVDVDGAGGNSCDLGMNSRAILNPLFQFWATK